MSEEKTRTDAWESCLTEEQQRELYAWSRTPIDDGSDTPRRPTYEQAKEYIRNGGCGDRNVATPTGGTRDGSRGGDIPVAAVPVPSRASWFRFLARQRKVDAIQQLTRIEAARDWGREVVSAAGMDPAELAAAFRAKAMDAMMDDDPKAVSAYAAAAAALQDRAQKAEELVLKERAQQTKDEQLKLAREKFEFDAAKKAMELAAEIKFVKEDDSLDDDEKINRVREALFGPSHTSQQS